MVLLCEVMFETDIIGYSLMGQTEECYFSGFYVVFHSVARRD